MRQAYLDEALCADRETQDGLQERVNHGAGFYSSVGLLVGGIMYYGCVTGLSVLY